MKTIHAIYGIKANNVTKCTYTELNGWPEAQGKIIVQLIKNYDNEALSTLFCQLEEVSDKNVSISLTHPSGQIKKCPISQAEYRYIINLDDETLEFYCKNNIPRAKFSLKNIRELSVDDTIAVMKSIDDKPEDMYNLLGVSA